MGSIPLTGLFMLALIALLYVGKVVLMPLAFAFVFALALRPAVRALGRLYLPASLASALVLLGIMGTVGGAVMYLSEPAIEWVDRMPRALRMVEQRTRPLRRPVEDVSELAGSVDRLIQVDKNRKGTQPREVTLERPSLMEAGVGAVMELLTGIVVMMIALYFMLVASQESLARMLGFAQSDPVEESATALVRRLEQQVSQYLRVAVVINASLGFAVGASLMLLGMPNPVLWGVLAAVLTFVPYLGPLVGVLAVALASIVTFPTLSQAALPPLAYMVLATIEGNLVTPLVLGTRLKINPLILFVWLVLWGSLWGIGGAVLAAPLLALIKLACDQNVAWSGLGRWLEG